MVIETYDRVSQSESAARKYVSEFCKRKMTIGTALGADPGGFGS